MRPYTSRCIHSFLYQATFDFLLLNNNPSPCQPLSPFPELGAAGQSDTGSPVTSVAASSPLWHLWQYRPQRDFLYCIKLAERRFSRCVAVLLASCDPMSQQILPWLCRICLSLSKFIFIRAILRETVPSTHGAIFLILGGWTCWWYLNHYASLEQHPIWQWEIQNTINWVSLYHMVVKPFLTNFHTETEVLCLW